MINVVTMTEKDFMKVCADTLTKLEAKVKKEGMDVHGVITLSITSMLFSTELAHELFHKDEDNKKEVSEDLKFGDE